MELDESPQGGKGGGGEKRELKGEVCLHGKVI